MIKKVLVGLAVLTVAVVIIEIVALVMLKQDKAALAQYWRQEAEKPGEFVYVALGDSAAQGLGASSPQKSYVGLLTAEIERQTGQTVRVVNLSVSGAKLHDLIIRQLPQLAEYQPDLITLEIGANDMGTYQPESFEDQFKHILQQLPADKTIVANMPYFGGIVRRGDSPRQANQDVKTLAAQYGFAVADLYTPLEAARRQWIYAADAFHPSDKGYQIWYGAFQPPLAKLLTP